MAINLNKIKNLPTYVQIIIVALPAVVLLVLFFLLIYKPKTTEMKALDTKLMRLTKEIQSGEAKIKRLDELIAENKELKAKLAELKEQLPEEKEVSVLLKQISELGLKSGLEILLWKPEARKTSPEGLYVELPVRVEVITAYHDLGEFFSHISRLPRLVNISDIALKTKDRAAEESKGHIEAKFMARTFASASAQDAMAATQGAQTQK